MFLNNRSTRHLYKALQLVCFLKTSMCPVNLIAEAVLRQLPSPHFRKGAILSSSFGEFEQSPLQKNQWEHKICSVGNKATAKNGVSCQSPNPDMWETRDIPVTESAASMKASGSAAQDKSGSIFATKEGQWDCTICLVRRESTATKCVACQNPSKTYSEVSLE